MRVNLTRNGAHETVSYRFDREAPMPILLGLIAIILAGLFWILRVHGTVRGLQAVDRDTKGLQRQALSTFEAFVGTPLQRVRDPRLAATILMIQLVRTGSPLTA